MHSLLKPRWMSALLLGLLILFFWQPEAATLAAGIALFIMGMRHLEDGFRAFTGGALERWLARCTNRMWKSLLFGVVSTALVQSSSLVTLLSIAFLSAGLMSLMAGIGIVFGANLGTTTGAWLLALVGLKMDLAAIAMPMLVFGGILGRRGEASWKGIGQVMLGIGFLFLGIDLMKDGFTSFQGILDPERYQISGWLGVVVYTLFGLLATVVMQSSHATLMITLAALATGQLDYANALAMAIGANLGTSVTSALGALASNQAGRRLGVVHVLFNLMTGAVALAALPLLTRSVDWTAELIGIAADAYTLKLALFHTLFNVLGLVIMLPLTPLLLKALMRWLPDPAPAVGPEGADLALSEQPRTRALYLNDSAMLHADTALKVLDQELLHLAALSRKVVASALYLPPDIHQGMSREQLHAQLQRPVPGEQREDADALYERHVKGVYGDIVDFISRLDISLLPEQQQALMDDNLAARDLVEAVKAAKHLQTNLRRQIDSPKEAVRGAYGQLREQCGLALIELARLADLEIDTPAREVLFARYEAEDNLFAEHFQALVQRLLRERLLDGWQATSLLNDLHYMLRIRRHLHLAHALLYDGLSAELEPVKAERIEPSLSLP